MRVFLLSTMFFLSCASYADDFTDVTVIRNHDGDTFTVDLKGLPPLFGEHITVRVKGLDTPEMRASRTCERAAAFSAQKFLEGLLKGAKVQLLNCERDKYFRLLCTVKAGDVDVTERLLKSGLAVVYNGETKKQWDCNKKNTWQSNSPATFEIVP